MQIGKGKPLLPCHDLHVLEAVGGMRRGVVRANCCKADAQRGKIAGVPDDAVDDRQHIGAMVADECNDDALWPSDIGKRISIAVGCRQQEVRRGPSEVTNRGCCSHFDLRSDNRNLPTTQELKRARWLAGPGVGSASAIWPSAHPGFPSTALPASGPSVPPARALPAARRPPLPCSRI